MKNAKLTGTIGQQSWTFWFVMCFMCIFFIVAPFYQGLFNGGQVFERPLYILSIWSAVTLVVISIYLYKHWRMNNPTDWMTIVAWLIPLSYLISFISAVSYYSAKVELLFHVVYIVFFLIGAYFFKSKLGAAILQYGLVGSGYVIVIHGLLNWFGNVHYFQAVLANQLSGVFQYPNTYAAYLFGILIVSLIFVTNAKKWYTIIPHAFMLFPIMISLLLTISRGGLIIIPLVLLVYLICIPWTKQLLVLIYLAILGGAALAVYSRMTTIQTNLSTQFIGSESMKGWVIVIALSIVITGIIYTIQRFIAGSKLPNHLKNVVNINKLIIPLSFIAFGIIGAYLLIANNIVSDQLPSGIKQKIQRISLEDASITSRIEFYKDSFSIAKDYPIIGAGGGAWASLYNEYKSFPYTSAQTHNVISQVLVDTGLVGFVIFFLFIGLCWYIFIRSTRMLPNSEWNEQRLIFPLFGLTILLHSTIDFDLSFAYLSALLFLSLGVLVAGTESKTKSPQTSRKKYSSVKLYSIIVACIAVVVFINALQAFRADKLYKQSQQAAVQTHDYNNIVKPLNAALNLQPNHPTYNLFKINVLLSVFNQTKDEQYSAEAEALLQKLEKSEPYNRQLIESEFSWFIVNGKYDQAAEWLQSKMSLHPWDINLYEKVINVYFDIGYQARLQGANEKMAESWEQSLAFFEKYKQKIEEFKSLPSSQQLIVFDVTPSMAMTVGKIHYIQGQYNEAFSMFKLFISTNLSTIENRTVARWYIATLLKLQSDTEIRKALISAYPEEKQLIEKLVADQF
ncbi:O-antigen ligase family protein [Cohnella panacarvi]|uniref:O-antigen ligase family protein n=1 Tax=Cohnella panacarvi TaxID=400776 RepID=UPI000479EAD6|nr:O-antigen ligase family protein [Cohnella panacarvi]